VAGFQVSKTVVRVDPAKLVPGGVPEVIEETIVPAPRPAGADAWAYVCKGRACLPPVMEEDALVRALGASK